MGGKARHTACQTASVSADRRADPPIPRPDARQERTLWLALLAGAAILGAALVWVSTPGGVATSPDSWNYIAAARNLLAGEGFTRYTGDPFVLWPPLFPALIAALVGLADLAGRTLHLLDALRVVNALTVAATVIAAGLLMRRFLRSAWVAALATLAVALGYPLVYVAAFAWSEPLFILLGLLAMIALDRHLAAPRDRTLLAAAILAGLAGVQRYTGAMLIVTGALALFVLAVHVPLRRRLRDAALFAGVAALPLALWLAHNQARAGTLTGERAPSTRTLPANVRAVYDLAVTWLTPERLGVGYQAAGLITGGALVLGLALLVARERHGALRWLAGLRALPLMLFAALYAAFVVVSAARVQYDPIDERLLAPLYVPVIGLAFAVLDRAVGWLRARGGRLPAYALVTLAALWLLYPADRLRDNLPTLRDISEASQVTYETWRESPLVRAVRAGPPGGRILTNAPLHLLVHSGLANEPVPAALDGWATLLEDAAGEEVTLIWFEPITRCDWGRRHCIVTDYTVETLAGRWDITPVIIAADGGAYRLDLGPDEQPGE